MPLLFSCGTRQEADVQWSTFGRLLSGKRDEPAVFEPSSVTVEQPRAAAGTGRTRYPNVAHNGRSDSCVRGTLYEVTDAELAAADAYEQPAKCERVVVLLASGRRVWAYVHPGRSGSHL